MTRSVLITGASTGFGAEVALGMAARGWRVFASMRNPAKAAPLVGRARPIASEVVVRVARRVGEDAAAADVLARTFGL